MSCRVSARVCAYEREGEKTAPCNMDALAELHACCPLSVGKSYKGEGAVARTTLGETASITRDR